MTKLDNDDLNCKRVKLNAQVQQCHACLEKDARIKCLEMQVKSLTRYVLNCVGLFAFFSILHIVVNLMNTRRIL